MVNGNKTTIDLLKTIKAFKDQKIVTGNYIISMCKEMFDRPNIGVLTADQLQLMIDELNKLAAAKQGATIIPPRNTPKAQPKGEIVSLDDYAKQYDISAMFLTMIRNKRTGKEKPFILRAGLLYKMSKKYGQNGYEIGAEPVTLAAATDGKYSTFKGTVRIYDKKGTFKEFTDYATATPENAPSQVNNLDEMASTRATNRAMRLATAMGLCSIEEISEYAGDESG